MGNSISCHQPCCRWTTDVDGELSVEGKRLGKHGEEEHKMNFDTNVLGPTNINLIGGGTPSVVTQDLKLFDESRFSRPHPSSQSRDSHSRDGTSPSKSKATQLERDEEPLPVAKANFGPIPKTKETSSRPLPSRSPATQSAKQFADAFSKEVMKTDRSKPPIKSTRPNLSGDFRVMPGVAWSKIYEHFASAKTLSVATRSQAFLAAPVQQKALKSIMPALWSSFHRHWTCQKTSATMAVEEELVQQLEQTVVSKIFHKGPTEMSILSSVGPAMWSPLHRKWCGHDALKTPKLPLPSALPLAPAIQKLVLAKDCGLLPALASSMLNVALNIETKPKALQDGKVCKESEATTPQPCLRVKCSVAPAVYSIWHKHWTGGRAT
ncbi:unnamed protein product [Durusdinium trenchii]|uniref:Uncharacterized protein n=2 Tax=Durusdinium trenchii TaxID=1381693 RepID=A0ABP0PNA0_9DINO